MIFGDCPYCGELFTEAVPNNTPAYAKISCGACGREFWERYSRIDPCAYTLEEFSELFEVDEQSKTVREKHPVAITPEVSEAALKEIERLVLYGLGNGIPRGIANESRCINVAENEPKNEGGQ